MGVYIFEFIGETTDKRRWFKVGFTGWNNPWMRLQKGKMKNLCYMPDTKMIDELWKRNLKLIRWYPMLEIRDELNIHGFFNGKRFGEWYSEQVIKSVVSFIDEEFDYPHNTVDDTDDLPPDQDDCPSPSNPRFVPRKKKKNKERKPTLAEQYPDYMFIQDYSYPFF